MTIKKWRPFWSYDIEKTEGWLSEMAANGDQLTYINLETRMFSFEKGEREKVEFQVVFDKSRGMPVHRLEEAGWGSIYSNGNWQFLKNAEPSISVYPVRDEILKRNRLHSNVFTGISIFYGMQLFFFATLVIIVLSVSEDGGFGQSIKFLVPYLLQLVAIIWLSIHAARKLRAFEKRYFGSSVDSDDVVGKTFVKWKMGWTHAPDVLENWLNDMGAKGNHLVRIQGARFVFQKGESKQVSYVYDFQLKTSLHYFDIHKSDGWQLMFFSTSSIARSSLWMKAYEDTEIKPRLTYDVMEQKAHVRKILMMSGGSFLFSLLITLFMFWIYTNAWNLFNKILMVALIMSLAIPISGMIRSYKYAERMKEV